MKLLKYYIPFLAMAGCMASCSDGDDFDIAPENQVNPGEMVIQMGRSASADEVGDLTANTRLFQFHADTDTTGNGRYVTKPQLTKIDHNKLSFILGEGWWDFSLVWCRAEGVTDNVIAPVHDRRAVDCPMWEQKSEGDELTSAPEIYTALVDRFKFSGHWFTDPVTNVDKFVPDQEYEVNADYVRNVAKLVVNFTSSEDLDPAQVQKITISNVPTTLNWRGGLYPNKINPEVSIVPLRGTFNLETIAENTTQGTNTLEFIVPAHRGTDYLNGAAAVDTTTSLLRLNVDLVCLDGSHVIKNNIILDKAPRVNGIYQIEVSYNKRKLNVSSTIIPWVEENSSAAAGNATIITDKTTIEMSFRDTLRIESPHIVSVGKASDASWLTINKINDKTYALEADINSYQVGHPRTSYLILKDGNLERRVPVTQRPETGTIEVNVAGQPNVREMWLSPPHNQKAVDVRTTGGPWKILPNLRVYDNVTGPVGESTNVMLTRFADSDIDYSDYNKAFGRERVVFMNTYTLDTASIWVDNLFIGLTDDIVEISQPDNGGSSTIIYQEDQCDFVAVYGGVKDVTILSLPDFIKAGSRTYYDKNTGIFHFYSASNPSGDDRWGYIELGHKSDPDYKVKLAVDQAILVNTPEFDYLCVKYTWDVSQGDVDTKTGFEGNPTSVNYHDIIYSTSHISNFNGKYVGWSWNSETKMWSFSENREVTCLMWGGDATQGQGEMVYFNAKEINKFPYPGMRNNSLTDADKQKMIPRVLSLTCNANWYSQAKSGPITCTIYCYMGGTMVKGTGTSATAPENDKNFYNHGGSLVWTKSASHTSNTAVSSSSKNYVHFFTVKYDRKRHTANVE